MFFKKNLVFGLAIVASLANINAMDGLKSNLIPTHVDEIQFNSDDNKNVVNIQLNSSIDKSQNCNISSNGEKLIIEMLQNMNKKIDSLEKNVNKNKEETISKLKEDMYKEFLGIYELIGKANASISENNLHMYKALSEQISRLHESINEHIIKVMEQSYSLQMEIINTIINQNRNNNLMVVNTYNISFLPITVQQ